MKTAGGRWTAAGPRARVPGPGDAGAGPPAPAPAWSWLVVPFAAVLLALPIFAHGCHSGDHDDEPLFAPRARQPESPR